MNDIREIKRKKERGQSNEDFFQGVSKEFKDADSIVVVGIDKEGYVSTYYTHSTSLFAIGMIEVAKNQIMSEMEC